MDDMSSANEPPFSPAPQEAASALERVRNGGSLPAKSTGEEQSTSRSSPWKRLGIAVAALIALASVLNLANQFWLRRNPGAVGGKISKDGSPGAGARNSVNGAVSPKAVAFLASHEPSLVTSDSSGYLTVFRTNASQGLEQSSRFAVTSGSVASLATSPVGDLVAVGHHDGTIAIWNAGDKRKRRQLLGHTDSVGAMVFSPDGSQLLSASGDETLRIWDVFEEKEIKRSPPKQVRLGPVSLAWLPEKNRALLGQSIYGIESCFLIDLETGAEVLRFGGTGATWIVALASDGEWACGLTGGSIAVWDGNFGMEIHRFGQDAAVAAFSADARRVVLVMPEPLARPQDDAANYEWHVSLWDVGTRTQIQSWKADRNDPKSAAISPDGTLAAVAYADGGLQLLKLPPPPSAP